MHTLNTARQRPSQGLVADWAKRISARWRQSLDAVLKTGRLIAEAKASLDHGTFTTMVESALPLGPRTAQRLMAIAADFQTATHVSALPSSWGTLYELTKLDDKQFESCIKDGTIMSEMERRDISAVVKKSNRATREADLGAKQLALPKKQFGVIYADPP